MNPREEDFSHRRSFRSSVPAGQQEAILKAGRWRFAARLLDESVEGAAVRVDGDPGVKAGDVVRLTTTSGGFDARVVRVAEFKPGEIDGNPDKPQFCLGLEWLRRPEMPPGVQRSLPESTRPAAPCPES